MRSVVSPEKIAGSLAELWSPRVVAEIVERKTTRHTGDVVTDKTRSVEELR